ncbi:MmgE/PrpD family protein [Paracoccus onubensis]|uniref:MmgE/PrpD family protein n=1 Tax=Paracoccus onubensis TaxID=1675788 RepID=A0A418SU29_9RHOB|nr:MmgE/PrpD family protein [Paracoccus onubensis]RJE84484.1 MmgE/PrpD family protein [Paracoccus onubensis]
MTRPVTRELAEWTVSLRGDDIPEPVRAEGVRSFVNWLGCAVGGSAHETIDRGLDAVRPFTGTARAQVIGRNERLDELHAALINGISSHVLDYDDTHLKTIIHPAGPIASAVLAVAEPRGISGQDVLTALVVGMEVECRIGNSVYPDHYDRGWHITGTAGVFGAAAAVGRLLDLDARQMTWAYSLAATQSSGLREMFGTMTKSFHPGRAAQNGAMSAFLAKANYDSSEQGIEAPRGWANVASTKQDYDEILGDLGKTWEAGLNSYKPYACGIVIHPTIDGCQQLRAKLGDRIASIASVGLRTHPLVLELTGKKAPATGLEGKFSVYHAAATALLYGDGSPTAFTDEMVRDPRVTALRDRVSAQSDNAVHEDEVYISVRFEDGSTTELHVEHAIGSISRPLSDEQIVTKFRNQSIGILGEAAADELIRTAWQLEDHDDIAAITRLSAPA